MLTIGAGKFDPTGRLLWAMNGHALKNSLLVLMALTAIAAGRLPDGWHVALSNLQDLLSTSSVASWIIALIRQEVWHPRVYTRFDESGLLLLLAASIHYVEAATFG